MSFLVDCPHCSTRVLPMAGRLCPSCRKNVDAPPDPDPDPDQVVEAAYGFAAEQMRAGLAPAEVQRILVERELDAETASNLIGDLERRRAEATRQEGQRNMMFGALWCFGGIAVTTLTFNAATNNGGKSMIAWGAILFGAIQFVRGLIQSAK